MSEAPSYGPPDAFGARSAARQGPPTELAMSPDDLKSSIAKAFHIEGGDLTGALIKEVNELIAVGDFWGGDEAGMKFYDGDAEVPGYAATAEAVMTESSAISFFYTGVATRLHDMGRNVEAADWAGIAEMPRILR